jgi:hypothetical protein
MITRSDVQLQDGMVPYPGLSWTELACCIEKDIDEDHASECTRESVLRTPKLRYASPNYLTSNLASHVGNRTTFKWRPPEPDCDL